MKKTIWRYFLFLLPLMIWLKLHWTYIDGRALIFEETYGILSTLIFFLDNLVQGVIPYWNPYILLGYPNQLTLNYFGYTNPVWLLIPVLNALGITVYFSFIGVVIGYFLSGVWAFYLSARIIFKNQLTAYCAFLLLLFSSANFPLFAQFHTIMLFLPGVWFFYFALRFYQKGDTLSFLGATLFVNIILCTYLPFYFLTVLLFLIFCLLLFYPGQLKHFVQKLMTYALKNRLLTILCLLALLGNLAPGLQTFRLPVNHEVVALMRNPGENIFKAGTKFNEYNATTDGDLSARMHVQEIYSHLNDFDYGNDGTIYISVFGWLLLLVALSFRLNKKTFFFAAFNFLLFLLLLGNGSALHPFLYKHIFYFHWMRNLFFSLPYLLATFILFIAAQIDNGLKLSFPTTKAKAVAIVYLTAIVGLTVTFLSRQEAVISSTYLAILASFLIFCSFISFKEKIPATALALLCLVAIAIQPLEVLSSYHRKILSDDPAGARGMVLPRPGKKAFPLTREGLRETGHIAVNPSMYYREQTIAWKDSLFYPESFPAFWTYFLFQNISRAAFDNYTRFKFVLYDQVQLTGEEIDFTTLDAQLSVVKNPALVYSSDAKTDPALKNLLSPLAETNPPAQGIFESANSFRVLKFSANDLLLKTNFEKDKLLVYNDSFTKGWHATVNGKKVSLYRANVAFKGVSLPKGENTVHLYYNPEWGRASYFWPFLANLLLLFSVLGLAIRNLFRRDRQT